MGIIRLTENEKLALMAAGIGLIIFAPKISAYLAAKASEGVVAAAGGVITGTVIGAGKVIGIPETDNAKCQADIANNDRWAMSADCTAGQFIEYASQHIFS
jgi:hypothetical protein